MKTLAGFSLVSAVLLAAPLTAGFAASPADYQTGSLEPRVRHVPTEIQKGVFEDPEKFREPLVQFLVDGETDPYRKVKLLHDWIADNIAYDVESYFSTERDASSGDDALRQGVAVCQGYGSLLEEMCDLAGIRCETISGYGRGYRFASGDVGSSDQENHVWNAVHIDGRWHLVDVTWDAGHVEDRKFQKVYRTTYLFMEPKHFVYNHLPKESKWQLLAAPLTLEQFERLPHLRGRFFDYGLRLRTRLYRVTQVSSSVKFNIGLTRPAELMATLYTADGDELPQRAMVQYDGDVCPVLATFPRAGRYRLKLYVRPPGQSGSFKLAANFDFDASGGTAKTFPVTKSSFDNMRGYLFRPLFLPLSSGEPLRFQVRLYDAHDVSLAIGDKPWLDLKRRPGDEPIYEVTATVPAGERVRLNAKRSPNDKSYKVVIDFSEE